MNNLLETLEYENGQRQYIKKVIRYSLKHHVERMTIDNGSSCHWNSIKLKTKPIIVKAMIDSPLNWYFSFECRLNVVQLSTVTLFVLGFGPMCLPNTLHLNMPRKLHVIPYLLNKTNPFSQKLCFPPNLTYVYIILFFFFLLGCFGCSSLGLSERCWFGD